jgi:hypothetical protein
MQDLTPICYFNARPDPYLLFLLENVAMQDLTPICA